MTEFAENPVRRALVWLQGGGGGKGPGLLRPSLVIISWSYNHDIKKEGGGWGDDDMTQLSPCPRGISAVCRAQ